MIASGNTVKIEYKGTLDDGTVFDTSEGREPLSFVVGSGQVIPGFDEGVIGMKVDEEKDLVIPSDKAYGEHNDQLVKNVPKTQVPNADQIKKGMTLAIQTQTGQQLPVLVHDVTDTEVVLDLNHPLAGKTLHFHIKIVSVA